MRTEILGELFKNPNDNRNSETLVLFRVCGSFSSSCARGTYMEWWQDRPEGSTTPSDTPSGLCPDRSQVRYSFTIQAHLPFCVNAYFSGSTNPTSKQSLHSKMKRDASNTSTFTREISLNTGSVPEAHQMSYANLKDKEDQIITEEWIFLISCGPLMV